MTLAALLPLIGVACKEKTPDPELPPLAHEGKNIMGCKINGKVWQTSGSSTFNSPDGVFSGFFAFDSTLNISGNAKEKTGYNIELNPKYNGKIGTYNLRNKYPYKAHLTDYNVQQVVMAGIEYYTDSLHTGSVKVTYYNGKIVAGTFEFDAVNDAGEVVHVTEGRFDISQ